MMMPSSVGGNGFARIEFSTGEKYISTDSSQMANAPGAKKIMAAANTLPMIKTHRLILSMRIPKEVFVDTKV